uniref:Uncharacterized protein n=1 Tax=Anguilla anguilla TaxID=7936 RepID=A0A0E9XNQ6_ANGAN
MRFCKFGECAAEGKRLGNAALMHNSHAVFLNIAYSFCVF